MMCTSIPNLNQIGHELSKVQVDTHSLSQLNMTVQCAAFIRNKHCRLLFSLNRAVYCSEIPPHFVVVKYGYST